MLVLSRQRDGTILIGSDIEVTVVDIRGPKVRLGIAAPQSVPVHRAEIAERIKAENGGTLPAETSPLISSDIYAAAKRAQALLVAVLVDGMHPQQGEIMAELGDALSAIDAGQTPAAPASPAVLAAIDATRPAGAIELKREPLKFANAIEASEWLAKVSGNVQTAVEIRDEVRAYMFAAQRAYALRLSGDNTKRYASAKATLDAWHRELATKRAVTSYGKKARQ